MSYEGTIVCADRAGAAANAFAVTDRLPPLLHSRRRESEGLWQESTPAAETAADAVVRARDGYVDEVKPGHSV